MDENPYKAPAEPPIEQLAQPLASRWQRAQDLVGSIPLIALMVLLLIIYALEAGWLTPDPR